jgi:hypothetical protein
VNDFLSKPVLFLLSATVLPALLFSQSTPAGVPSTTAIVVNSGSTNFMGYQITVAPSGSVSYVMGKKSGKGKLTATLTQKFFQDIKAAMPLSQLPKQGCIKSTSFGTSTVIILGSERSPDVSCPGTPKETALNEDAEAIAKVLKISKVPRLSE